MCAATVEVGGPIGVNLSPYGIGQSVSPLINNSLVVGSTKITEDVVSCVHVCLTGVLHVLAQFGRSRTGEGSSGGRKRGVV